MKKPYLKRGRAGSDRSPNLIDRRHLLKFAGGATLGTLLSPLPWKVLDDVSIWTQNWSWIPVPPKGQTVIRHSTCGLCPAGCGVKVRCVGAQPVGLAGLAGHPISRGFLCPGGLLGHHLPYAPQRATQPLRFNKGANALSREQLASELGRILAGLRSASSQGRVAVLDPVVGRSTSKAYRQFLAQFPNSVYIAWEEETSKALRVFDGVQTAGYPELGIDLERAGTILSFGADLTGGWGTPGAVWKSRQASVPGSRLIQIEPRYSNTAAIADSWLPVLPGRESFLALGLAGVILKERLVDPNAFASVSQLDRISDFRELLNSFPPSRCAEACGIGIETMTATARVMSQGRCLAVLGDSGFSDHDYLAVNLLNLAMGAVGREGGIVPRRRLPGNEVDDVQPIDLCDVPDRSIAFLLIDETVSRPAISPSLIERKLIPDKGVVVSLSPSGTAALGAQASCLQYVLPTPLYLESIQEIPGSPASPIANCSFSVPILPAPPAALSTGEWIRRLAESEKQEWQAASEEKQLESRAKAVWETRRGSVFGYAEGTAKPTLDFASAEDLAKAFKAGACWLDSPADGTRVNLQACAYFKPESWGKLKQSLNQPIELGGNRGGDWVTVVPFSAGKVTAFASPLSGKLTRESQLYPTPGDALLSPATAARLALEQGQLTELETGKGRLAARVRLDETAMPDVVFVAVSGGSKCEIGDEGGWRATPAKLRRSDV